MKVWGRAHVVVRRVSCTVEAENQGAVPGTLRVRDLRVGDPFGLVLGGRDASAAAAVEQGSRGGEHLGG